jgi:hypothetical protein
MNAHIKSKKAEIAAAAKKNRGKLGLDLLDLLDL